MEDEMAPENVEAQGDPVEAEASEDQRALVSKLMERIKDDCKHYEDRFKQMKRDMKIARVGAAADWPKDNYKANIVSRHINNSVAALYAKNPRPVARRRPRLDFQVWDETQTSLQQALQTTMMATQTGMVMSDPMTGTVMSPDPMVQQALTLLQDFEAGMQERRMIDNLGRTLEVLFTYYMGEQQPLDFKTAMKQLVRRAKTCGVAYIEIDFQRDMETDGDVTSRIEDYRQQLRHIQGLTKEIESAQEGETTDGTAARRAELQSAISALQKQQYVLLREGLAFEWLQSTRVIPAHCCTNIVGFVNSPWLTVEYFYTPAEVLRIFDIDLKRSEYTQYRMDGTKRDGAAEADGQQSFDWNAETAEDKEYVRVLRHFDKNTGSVYYMAEGHKDFLRPPAPPSVYVEGFWPIYAVTFNAVEDPEMAIPPSDVELMLDMQTDYNRARQGQREHRKASRPRYATPKGALGDDEKMRFATSAAHDVIEFNPQGPDPDIRRVIQPIPLSGVDPNLYETGGFMQDIQLVVGAQEASFGAVSKATATESSIAEGSRVASVESNIDDLDNFLNAIARGSGQVLLREMSSETVRKVAGRGAIWPELRLDEIADELYLEVEAGSSGKPNQAQEIANWERMLPYLVQIPSIAPDWLARETLRRLDDRMDLTDAIAQGEPAIVALNRMSQPQPADPSAAPDQQGGEGGDNGPSGRDGPSGSNAPMGNNQV